MGRFFCGDQQLALKCLEFKEQIHKFIFTQSAWSCEVHSKVTCESKMGCLAPCWIMIFMRSDPAAKMTDSAWLLNKILLKTATNVRQIWEHIYNKFRSASVAYSKPSAQHSWICSPSPFLTVMPLLRHPTSEGKVPNHCFCSCFLYSPVWDLQSARWEAISFCPLPVPRWFNGTVSYKSGVGLVFIQLPAFEVCIFQNSFISAAVKTYMVNSECTVGIFSPEDIIIPITQWKVHTSQRVVKS